MSALNSEGTFKRDSMVYLLNSITKFRSKEIKPN